MQTERSDEKPQTSKRKKFLFCGKMAYASI